VGSCLGTHALGRVGNCVEGVCPTGLEGGVATFLESAASTIGNLFHDGGVSAETLKNVTF
jgi:hypothetical protein